jgi:Tol biopolymer transport system component
MRRLPLLLAAVAAALIAASAASAASSQTLAFTEGAASGVYTINMDGGSPAPLTSGFVPSFSPNGNRLATVSSSGALQVGNANGKGAKKTIATGLGAHPAPAAWSPNGKQLAYVKQGSIYVVNATGGKARRIYAASPSTDPIEQFATHTAWAPNGKTVYFIQTSDFATVDYTVASVPVTGGKITQIPNIAPEPWLMTGFSLSVSADGQTLAVTMAQIAVSQTNPNGTVAGYGIGLIPTAGGSVDLIPNYTAASFAPTGTNMCAQTGSGGLVTLTPGGVASTPVASGSNPTACTWVP